MRRSDAVCAQYDRPDGVAFRFQVCRYSVEPAVPNSVLHLLANNSLRAALADEPEEGGPEVAGIGVPEPASGDGVGLAGAASGPDSVGGPKSTVKAGKGPPSDSAEGVELVVSPDFIWVEFKY